MRTFLILTIIFSIGLQKANSQFLKNLKKKAEAVIEEKIDERLGGQEVENNSTQPRTEDKNGPKKVDHNNISTKRIVLRAPNSGLKDIILYEHKSLPLFKGNNITDSDVAYKKLLEMKYLLNVYQKMDRVYLGADKSSIIPQVHLLSLAGYILKEEGMLKFLANDQGNIGAMSYKRAPYMYRPRKWGGDFANTFESQKAFGSFNERHFNDLMEWSKTLWPKDYQNAFVTKASSGFYDFKKEGIWISFKQGNLGMGTINHFIKYAPKYDHENILLKKTATGSNPFVFFKLGSDKAEKLFNSSGDQARLYLLHRVKLAKKENQPPENINDVENPVEFIYYLDSNIVEIYSDEGLKNKIGELDYKNLEFR